MQATFSSGTGQPGWFDFTPLLGGAPVQALLSQRDGDYIGVPLAEQRGHLARQLGFSPERVAVPRQVHGGKVELAVSGQVHPDTDGLVTNDPRVVLSLQVADCAPVFLYHPPTRYRGLVHAGWRGLASGVVRAGADLLRVQGVDLGQVDVVIGPTIERACYEVGPEVVEHFAPAIWQPNSNGRFQLDLVAAVREQLVAVGIPAAQITDVDVCTLCDPRCHSYRREGKQAGRMVAFYYEQL